MKNILFIVILGLFTFQVNANNGLELNANEIKVLIELDKTLQKGELQIQVFPKKNEVKFKRGKAIIFTVLTGFLGGHRIYLGTHHRTPIIYSVTLGGLGILPLVDLVNIIFTKDISKFENRSQIIMWGD